jgi:D-lactate dehydrogenase (cytochrome)
MTRPGAATGVDAVAAATQDLRRLLADRCTTNRTVREQHGRDESYLPPAVPDAVVLPVSTDEVREIILICARYDVPVIPFGAGTSLEGHVLAPRGGVSVDLSQMNTILEIHNDDLDVTVEAGVTRSELNRRLGRDGLFFPVDPGADATLGGMAATGASGTTSVKYGAMATNVLSLEVVLPDGSVIRTGSRARKSAAGYDLTRLFVGSEGTLGIITKLTLRVFGIPEAVSAAVVQFTSLRDALDTVVASLQLAIPISRIELLDAHAIKAVNAHAGLTYDAAPTLFVEFEGTPGGTEDALRSFRSCASEHGPSYEQVGLGREQRDQLWRARHEALFASLALRAGCRSITTDVCVPISHLADCILETEGDLQRASFPSTLVGHVGDGNFHVLMLVDPESQAELEEAQVINERLVRRAIAAEGTCTGEHGIGSGKRRFLQEQAGPAVGLMRDLKVAIDPKGIMNPDKVI